MNPCQKHHQPMDLMDLGETGSPSLQRRSGTPEVPMDRILAGGRPWAMNRLLGGVALTAVPKRGETVLFFECKPGSHPAGGPELVPAQPRREGRYVIGFVDGHAELVSPAELGRLVWNPQVSPAPPAPAPGPVPPVPAPVVKPAPPPPPAGRLPRSQDKGPRRRAPPPRGDRAPDLPP
jgi:hypothetical protein